MSGVKTTVGLSAALKLRRITVFRWNSKERPDLKTNMLLMCK